LSTLRVEEYSKQETNMKKAENNILFVACLFIVFFLVVYSSSLKMEKTPSSETSVDCQWNRQLYISEDIILYHPSPQ
jgi:hypothetical protein